jgi:hypothetical protein
MLTPPAPALRADRHKYLISRAKAILKYLGLGFSHLYAEVTLSLVRLRTLSATTT